MVRKSVESETAGTYSGSGQRVEEWARSHSNHLFWVAIYQTMLYDIDGALEAKQWGLATAQMADALQCCVTAVLALKGHDVADLHYCWQVLVSEERDLAEIVRPLRERQPETPDEVLSYVSDVKDFIATALGVKTVGYNTDAMIQHTMEIRDWNVLSQASGIRTKLQGMADTEETIRMSRNASEGNAGAEG